MTEGSVYIVKTVDSDIVVGTFLQKERGFIVIKELSSGNLVPIRSSSISTIQKEESNGRKRS